MNGLEMLLKSFGVNPEEIKKSAGEMQTLAIRLDARLSQIETDQKLILELMQARNDDNG